MFSRNKQPFCAVEDMAEGDNWSTSSFDTISSFGELDAGLEESGVDSMISDEDLSAISWTGEDVVVNRKLQVFPCSQLHQDLHRSVPFCVSDSDDESMELSINSSSEPSTTQVTRTSTYSRSYKNGTSISELFPHVPDDVLCEIFKFLDVATLSRVLQVSKRFLACGQKDAAGWKSHFKDLRQSKLHISPETVQLEQTKGAINAFKTAWKDAKSRNEVTMADLCYDPETATGTVFHFRFKEAAGNSWTSFDPWHAGRAPRKMVFLRDGTVKEMVNSSMQTGNCRLVEPFSDATHVQNNPNRMRMTWRFISTPMDLPCRPLGAYLRLNIAGRDVPTYVSRRSPTGNWGFVIENCWGVFASFELPLKNETEQGRPVRPTRMRLRRTSNGGVHWLNVQGVESDSEDEDCSSNSFDWLTEEGRLLADRALTVTSRTQWREALLYNYGSIVLPEGTRAKDEFDRIFNSYRYPIENLGNPIR